MDSDFIVRHQAGEEHAGIVYYKQHSRTIGEIVHYLELIAHCMAPHKMHRQFEFVARLTMRVLTINRQAARPWGSYVENDPRGSMIRLTYGN